MSLSNTHFWLMFSYAYKQDNDRCFAAKATRTAGSNAEEPQVRWQLLLPY